MRGPLGAFFRAFNRWFARGTDAYVAWSGLLIRKAALAMLLLLGIAVAAGYLGARLPTGFIPPEDQGYLSVTVQLPPAASTRAAAACVDAPCGASTRYVVSGPDATADWLSTAADTAPAPSATAAAAASVLR